VHKRIGLIAAILIWMPQIGLSQAGSPINQANVPAATFPDAGAPTPANDEHPLLQLGPGDQLRMEVFGRPEMDSTMYVGDDGTVRVPLAGAVAVSGLSPAEAAQKVEAALKDGQFLVNPQVTFSVVKSLSQRVSVLGDVHQPGRYPIESDTTILDLLAMAGGRTDKGDDVIYLMRRNAAGTLEQFPVDLNATTGQGAAPAIMQTLRGGDRIFVPPAQQFFVSGEVHAPASYRLDKDMTILEAISRAGGITDRGSIHRVEVKRRDSSGKYLVTSANPNDKVAPNDVITVKERIF
jgi:polysaccharide biosynthesis/export protein